MARPDQLAYESDATSRLYDATRDMHWIRDHGQFGSAPSHDDYSDEGEA